MGGYMSKDHIRLFVYLLFCLAIIALTGCAGVNHNRYQTAETLGKGNMKMMAGSNISPVMHHHARFELEDKHDEEMRRQGIYDGAGSALEEIFDSLGAVFTTWPGDMEILYAIGVKDNVDLEFRLGASPTLRFNSKIKIAEFGKRGALAIAPGLGIKLFGGKDTDGDEMVSVTDEFTGYITSLELPFILGWEFDRASPYLYFHDYLHAVSIEYRRHTQGLPKNYDETFEETYYYNALGGGFGVQFLWGKFVLTPELGLFWLNGPEINMGMPSFGLALGGKW